jgi:hypothetical protein
MDKRKQMVLQVDSLGNMWDKFLEQTQPVEKYEGAIFDLKTTFISAAIMVVGECLTKGLLHLKPEHKEYIFQSWREEAREFLVEVDKNNELAKKMKGRMQ